MSDPIHTLFCTESPSAGGPARQPIQSRLMGWPTRCVLRLCTRLSCHSCPTLHALTTFAQFAPRQDKPQHDGTPSKTAPHPTNAHRNGNKPSKCVLRFTPTAVAHPPNTRIGGGQHRDSGGRRSLQIAKNLLPAAQILQACDDKIP